MYFCNSSFTRNRSGIHDVVRKALKNVLLFTSPLILGHCWCSVSERELSGGSHSSGSAWWGEGAARGDLLYRLRETAASAMPEERGEVKRSTFFKLPTSWMLNVSERAITKIHQNRIGSIQMSLMHSHVEQIKVLLLIFQTLRYVLWCTGCQ